MSNSSFFAVSKTPLRVSLFGGGTDYPEYFQHSDHTGAALSLAIDRYIYISFLLQPKGIKSEYCYRSSYSKIEEVLSLDDFEHPVIKAICKDKNFTTPFQLNVTSDLPVSSGLGSSSSFTVGLANLVNTILSYDVDKQELAKYAIKVERDILKENVGYQDQFAAAYGGINYFTFKKEKIAVDPIILSKDKLSFLLSSLVLVSTGQKRYASQVLNEQIDKKRSRKLDKELKDMFEIAVKAKESLLKKDSAELINDLAMLLKDNWKLKKLLSSYITNSVIDELYDIGIQNGALAGKICGAGNGGMILFIVEPERVKYFLQKMSFCHCTQFNIANQGSEILYMDNIDNLNFMHE